jgi:hypothetical protein
MLKLAFVAPSEQSLTFRRFCRPESAVLPATGSLASPGADEVDEAPAPT